MSTLLIFKRTSLKQSCQVHFLVWVLKYVRFFSNSATTPTCDVTSLDWEIVDDSNVSKFVDLYLLAKIASSVLCYIWLLVLTSSRFSQRNRYV